jgi:hypothetical protein
MEQARKRIQSDERRTSLTFAQRDSVTESRQDNFSAMNTYSKVRQLDTSVDKSLDSTKLNQYEM